MKIRFTRPADGDLTTLVDYISSGSPHAAVEVLDRILTGINRLADFPQLGHVGRLPDTLELTVTRTPYIVVYRLMNDEVIVLRIRHGAMRWPPEL